MAHSSQRAYRLHDDVLRSRADQCHSCNLGPRSTTIAMVTEVLKLGYKVAIKLAMQSRGQATFL